MRNFSFNLSFHRLIMVYSVRVADPRNKFSASHFLFKHEKCSRLHGHNYQVSVEVSGDLTEDYYVVDFYRLKSEINQILERLDHAILLPGKSQDIHIQKKNGQILVDFNNKHYEFPEEDVRILEIPATTAELLAKYIHDALQVKFPNHHLNIEVGESVGSIGRYSTMKNNKFQN